MDYNENDRNEQSDQNNRETWKNAQENWNKWEEEQEKKNWDHWDSNASHSSYYNQPTHTPYDQGFSMASMILGLLSVTLGCCGLSVPLGALGILFFVLCHRKGKTANTNCQIGLVLSILGLVGGIISYAYVLYLTFHSPEFMEQLNQTSRLIYGVDYTEMLQNLSGFPTN